MADKSNLGGVIQVTQADRWGAVREALLEDRSLSLDARAVGAWLSVKASGWEIRIAALRRAMGGEKPLGKDRWLRIAKELESAGNFQRACHRGDGGRWIWQIVFTPVPSTVVGFSDHGQTGRGPAVSGKSGHKTKPALTPPVLTPPQQQHRGGGDELIYPHVHPMELEAISQLIAESPQQIQQQLLDELAGAIQKNTLKRGPIPFMRALVGAARDGKFSPNLAVAVAAARQSTQQCLQDSDAFVCDPIAQEKGKAMLETARKQRQQHG
jgi:hypothetical protein